MWVKRNADEELRTGQLTQLARGANAVRLENDGNRLQNNGHQHWGTRFTRHILHVESVIGSCWILIVWENQALQGRTLCPS